MEVVGRVIQGNMLYELMADRSWRVASSDGRLSATERILRDQYDNDDWFGPAQGSFGARVLHDLAANVGGIVSYQEPPEDPSVTP